MIISLTGSHCLLSSYDPHQWYFDEYWNQTFKQILFQQGWFIMVP